MLTPAALLGLIVGAGVLARLYRFGEPILDRHEFRQTQTAATVWLWNRDGFDPLSYHVPMFGNGNWVLEFPLYQGAVWALQVPLGGIESAARLVSIGSYVAATVLLYLIARRWLGGPAPALLAAAVFSLLPLTVFFFRTVLIDTLAVALTLLAIYAAVRVAEAFSWTWLAVLCLAAPAAALVKASTVLALGAALLVLGLRILRRPDTPRGARAAVLALPPVTGALLLVWTRHADGLNLASGALTFSNGRDWFLGSTFTDGALWQAMWSRLDANLGPLGLLLLAAGVAGLLRVPRRHLPEIAATVAGGIVAIGVFANLNGGHEYYQLPQTVTVGMLAGLGLWTLAGLAARAGHGAAAPAVAASALVVLAAGSWSELRAGYFGPAAIDGFVAAQGLELRANTPDERLLLIQENGDPSHPALWYEARRVGWRVPTSDPARAAKIIRDHPDVGAIVFVKGPAHQPGFVTALAEARGFAQSYDGATLRVYRRVAPRRS